MDFPNVTHKPCLQGYIRPIIPAGAPVIEEVQPNTCGKPNWSAPLDLFIRPAIATVENGSFVQYRAYLELANGETKDVTESAVWGLTNYTLADMANGKATGKGSNQNGESLSVNATFAGLKATATLISKAVCTAQRLAICLCLDRSGTMGIVGPSRRTRISLVKEAAQILIRNLRPGRDRIGLVTFAGKIWFNSTGQVSLVAKDATVDAPLSSEPSALLAALEEYEMRGNCQATNPSPCCTGIGGGLESARVVLQAASADERKVIILLTDGADNIEVPNPVSEATLAKTEGTMVVTVGVDVESTYLNTLRSMASSNKHYALNQAEDVLTVFSELPNLVCNDNPCSGLGFLTQSLPNGRTDEPYTATVEAYGGSNYVYSIEGSKPEGLEIHSETGEITWATPLEASSYTITVKVTSGDCSYSRPLSFGVTAPAQGQGWHIISFERLCDNPPTNEAGEWGQFGPNVPDAGSPATDDFHWRALVSCESETTFNEILVYNGAADGTNETGQYWATTNKPSPDGVAHYPLVVYLDSVKQNDAYNQNIVIPAGLHWLDLYGQVVIQPPANDSTSKYGFFHLSMDAIDKTGSRVPHLNHCDVPCEPRNIAWKRLFDTEDWSLAPYLEMRFGTGANGFLRWRVVHSTLTYAGDCREPVKLYSRVIGGFGAGDFLDGELPEVPKSNINESAGSSYHPGGQFVSNQNGKPNGEPGITNTSSNASIEFTGSLVRFVRPAPTGENCEGADATETNPQYCVNAALQIGCVDSDGNVSWPDIPSVAPSTQPT